MAKIIEIIEDAKKLGFKTVECDDMTWSIEQFESATFDFEGDYGFFNDPKGGRVDWLNHENGIVHGCYYFRW